jgi:hypothetical protein
MTPMPTIRVMKAGDQAPSVERPRVPAAARKARPTTSSPSAMSKPRRTPQRSTRPPNRNWLKVMPPASTVTTQPACSSLVPMFSTQ